MNIIFLFLKRKMSLKRKSANGFTCWKMGKRVYRKHNMPSEINPTFLSSHKSNISVYWADRCNVSLPFTIRYYSRDNIMLSVSKLTITSYGSY